MLAFIAFAHVGCGEVPDPRASTLPDLSHLEIVNDENADVHRIRRALVTLCLQEHSLAEAVEPTATGPAHALPGEWEIQIDLWLIDAKELTFRLMTASEKPIWTVSGTLIEIGDRYIADATITELHYQ